MYNTRGISWNSPNYLKHKLIIKSTIQFKRLFASIWFMSLRKVRMGGSIHTSIQIFPEEGMIWYKCSVLLIVVTYLGPIEQDFCGRPSEHLLDKVAAQVTTPALFWELVKQLNLEEDRIIERLNDIYCGQIPTISDSVLQNWIDDLQTGDLQKICPWQQRESSKDHADLEVNH